MSDYCIVCDRLSAGEIVALGKVGNATLCNYHSEPSELTVYFPCCGEEKILDNSERERYLSYLSVDYQVMRLGGAMIIVSNDHCHKFPEAIPTVYLVFPFRSQPVMGIN